MGRTRQSGAADDYIIYVAQVDDQTKAFFDQFDKNVENTASKGAVAFQSFSRNITPAGSAIDLVSGAMIGLGSRIVDFATDAVASLKDFIVESVDAATEVNLLGETIDYLGSRTGLTSDQVKNLENDIRSQGVSLRSAREFMIAMVRANIDFSQSMELVRIAQDAAVISQRSVSESLTRLISAIQKSEPRLLDELGIQVRREEAYRRQAIALGKTQSELTEYEKRLGFVNEIVRKAAVFSGAYEATLDNVGRQAVEVSRYADDLKVQIGQIFQPSRAVLVQEYTQLLQDAAKWFEENSESVEFLSKVLADATVQVLKLVNALLTTAVNIPSTIRDAGVEVAQYFAAIFDIASPEEIARRTDSITTYFFQALSLVGGFISASVTGIVNSLKLINYVVDATIAKIRGNDDEVKRNLTEFQNLYDNFGQLLQDSFGGAVVKIGEYTGLIGEATTETEDMTTTSVDLLSDLNDGLEDTSAKVEKVVNKFKDLRDAIQNALDKRAIDDVERAFDELERQAVDALRDSFRRQDIEKRYQERLADIRAKARESQSEFDQEAAEERIDLAEETAKRREEIEKDYARRIEDILADFAFNVDELARSRDAVGILRLIRQKNKDLSDAKKDRDRDLADEADNAAERQEDLEKRLEKRRRTIQDSLADEIADAEKARQEDLANLELSNQRDQQIRELQEQFKQAARERAFARELQDFEKQYRQLLEDLDVNLNSQTLSWVLYFTNLFNIVDQGLGDIEQLYRDFDPSTGFNLPGIPNPDDLTPPPLPGTGTGGNRRTPTIGQAGIVSQLLGNNVPSLFNNFYPQTPIRGGDYGNSYKRVEVVVDAPTLEPYFQRMLVTTISEIERNSNA